jgi:FlaA1/EpsC-like NDP-sugar epimerase
MPSLNALRSRTTAMIHDLLVIPVAWFTAYWLRFNLENIPEGYWQTALMLLPITLIVQGASFWYFGLYRGIWRFASVPDLIRITKAVAAGVAASAVAIFLITRLEGVPRSVFVLDAVLLVLLLGGPRFLYRWLKDRHLYATEGQRALIVGAGKAGEMLVRELLRDVSSPYRPIGFVDDAARKRGMEIHGIPVLGACADIPALVAEHAPDLLLIALPSANSRQLRRIVELCEATGLPFRTLPRMQDLVSGRAGLKDLRDVTIDDLLGREAVRLDWQQITHGIRDRTVLVTGGGGSIGSELCRQVARLEPARVVILERSEFNLFEIERELRRHHPHLALEAVLGDVCDARTVESVMRRFEPSIVFHAAAYKHVPMLESQSRAGAHNNILGTRVVAAAADRHGCETFVLISTDKAVNPGNVMGATKRVAEMICQHLASRSKTHFITVRFGNVLGSSGSVVPLFREQIARGGPVTVTHPEVTRYFMTIPEACQLILQAAAIGKGGEIFVLDMGEPVRIAYLAEQMVRLSGRQPGEEIEIVYSGLRPGEKLHEELFHSRERLTDTSHPKILLAASRPVDGERLEQALSTLERACQEGDEARVGDILRELVPEHRSQVQTGVAATSGEVIHPPQFSRKSGE